MKRVVGDLSGLPGAANGPSSLGWWGNIGFMAIEGTAFALAAGSYLYLMSQSAGWPPAGDRPPDLLWGTIFTLGLLLSEIPNRWVAGRAADRDARGARIGVLVMALAGLLLLVPRALEFGHLNVPWHQDAYGSVMWMLMLLHTLHIITDLGDTMVLSALICSHEVGDSQFADVRDNSAYWTFVVLTWLPIYGIVYWLPRLA